MELTYSICSKDADSAQSKESKSGVLGEAHYNGGQSIDNVLDGVVYFEKVGDELCFDAIWLFGKPNASGRH